MKVFFCVLFVLSLRAFSAPVLAQNSLKPVDPAQYQYARQQEVIDQALSSTDPATLSEQQWMDILDATTLASDIPIIGGISGDAGVYTGATGLSGIARGSMPYGIYAVQARPIEGIQALYPQTLRVDSQSHTLAIGLREQPKLSLWNQWLIWIQGIWKKQQPLVATPVVYPNAAMTTIVVFEDINGNGTREQAEKTVPWAHVRITLTKQSKEELVTTTSGGTKTLQWKTLPFGLGSSQDVLRLVYAEIGGDSTLIRIDTQEIAGIRDGVIYGQAFPLAVNAQYLLTTSSGGSFLFLYQ